MYCLGHGLVYRYQALLDKFATDGAVGAAMRGGDGADFFVLLEGVDDARSLPVCPCFAVVGSAFFGFAAFAFFAVGKRRLLAGFEQRNERSDDVRVVLG